MRHNRDEKRFGRSSGHLKSMLSNMTNDLISYGRIKTTTPKAKLLRRYAERMITLGKSGTLSSRRRAMAFLRSKSAVTKLFSEIAGKYKDRNGGYTRILKLGARPGDNAAMSIIELVEEAKKAETKPKTTKKAAPKKAAPKKAAPKDAASKDAPKKAAPKKAAPAKESVKKESSAKPEAKAATKAAAAKAPAKKKQETKKAETKKEKKSE